MLLAHFKNHCYCWLSSNIKLYEYFQIAWPYIKSAVMFDINQILRFLLIYTKLEFQEVLTEFENVLNIDQALQDLEN